MISDILNAIKMISGYLGFLQSAKVAQRDRLLDALVAVHKAANLTRSYLADVAAFGAEGERVVQTRQLNIFPREIRLSLSEAWVDVGRKLATCSDNYHEGGLERVLNDLSERCFAKGQFWAAPADYENSGVDIELGKLLKETSKAIRELRP